MRLLLGLDPYLMPESIRTKYALLLACEENVKLDDIGWRFFDCVWIFEKEDAGNFFALPKDFTNDVKRAIARVSTGEAKWPNQHELNISMQPSTNPNMPGDICISVNLPHDP